MKNLDKYLTLLDGDVDGLLLTSRYSRHYGAEFDIAEGVAIVTKKGCRYFTDSRYIESAEKNLKGFEVLDVNREVGYIQRLNTAIADFGVTTLGYEEHYLTAEEYFHYDEKLNAKLVPFHKPIYAFRATKEDWELELMRKAQAITDRAFAEVITRIKPGMTELELQAELIYCMYKNGGTGLAFDPIVVSGPNTSLPHGVAGERVIQKGDFVTMDFGCKFGGYCSDMTRTVAVGHVTEEMETVYNTVLKAQLAGIAADAGVKWNVHLPTDGGFATEESGRRYTENIIRAIDLTRELEPHTWVMHVVTDHIPGPDMRPHLTERETERILRSLEQITPHLPAPECLALENLERHPTDYLDKLVSATPHSRCFDIGHVWKEGLRPEELLPLWLPDIRMCHLHGLEKRDHKSLHHMAAATLDAILHPMWDIRFSPLITLEVFSLDDFLNSHQAMLESHERYISKH